ALIPHQIELDRAVINAISGQPIARVDLVSLGGTLVYSTDYGGGKFLAQEELHHVASGQQTSRYVPNLKLHLFNGDPVEVAAVITASPVYAEWSAPGDGPVAVLVAYRDVSDAVVGATAPVDFERLAVVAVTMAALFGLLLWIVARGHRFTSVARERLAAMLDSEREMRTQLDVRNAELEEANQAKSRFLSMVSHELKTPLTSITTFAILLQKRLSDSLGEREVKHFDALVRNSGRLKVLIDDLLDVSASASGELRLSMEQVVVSEVVNEAVLAVQPITDSREQELSISIDDPNARFAADPVRIQQVIVNLLSNASKYSPEGSVIELSVTSELDIVCFKITDHGMGISEEDQKSLFSTFFRTQEAVSSGISGTGLGLVIVRSIVEGHGGTVRLESSVGVGTSVYVEMPASVDSAEVNSEAVQESAA
ncbi:MAG: HAMP domain-containing sensor histidine kinase, partial [Chloroflexi bacterium]|nr:HAMP domain-containing sensor histidine kinase [Chloroflexota bacterium]